MEASPERHWRSYGNDPAYASAIFDALCCFFSQDNSALDTDEMIECIAEELAISRSSFTSTTWVTR